MSVTYNLDRKSLRRADVFLQKANKLVAFARSHTKSIIVLAGLFVVLGASFTGYRVWKADQETKGANAFYAWEKKVADALRQNPKKDSDSLAKLEPLFTEGKRIAHDYRFARTGYEVYMLMGDISYDRGDYASAQANYLVAVSASDSRHSKAAALLSIAYAAEADKRYEDAIQSLRQVVASGVREVKGEAMLALARNLQHSGKFDDAKKQLNEVRTEYPNTMWSTSAEGLEKLWASTNASAM